MAVPRPVLLAILGLALCVAAFVGVRGLGSGQEDIVPAPIPTTETPSGAAKAEPGARGRARTRPQAEEAKPAAPAKPAEDAGQAASRGPERKVSPGQVEKLKADALLATVAKALGEDDVVILFFTRPGAADDTGARSAVRELRGMKGVQVFSPRFEDLDDYRPVLAGAGVSQVPSIVIATPGAKAQVVEGYVDRQSLRQRVEDALR